MKIMSFESYEIQDFFVIYFMFRKVTVFSLQGGWEARWKREADDPAMTHVVQNLCPGGYCSRPGHSGGTTVAYSLWTNRVSIRVANPTKNLKWFSGIFLANH